jgi:hypothetical protein
MDPEIAHDYPLRGKLGKLPEGISPGRELTAETIGPGEQRGQPGFSVGFPKVMHCANFEDGLPAWDRGDFLCEESPEFPAVVAGGVHQVFCDFAGAVI